jgi:hypothetical protein
MASLPTLPSAVPPLERAQQMIEGLGPGYTWIGFTSVRSKDKKKGTGLVKSYRIQCPPPSKHEYEVTESKLLVDGDAACVPCSMKRVRSSPAKVEASNKRPKKEEAVPTGAIYTFFERNGGAAAGPQVEKYLFDEIGEPVHGRSSSSSSKKKTKARPQPKVLKGFAALGASAWSQPAVKDERKEEEKKASPVYMAPLREKFKPILEFLGCPSVDGVSDERRLEWQSDLKQWLTGYLKRDSYGDDCDCLLLFQSRHEDKTQALIAKHFKRLSLILKYNNNTVAKEKEVEAQFDRLCKARDGAMRMHRP